MLALCLAAPVGAELRDYPYDPDALPRPILDGREDWIELYYKAWDLAADNINFAKPGTGFVAEYMDEALTDNKIWQWDTLFITMFAKYSNGELPIMDGVDNFYRKQRSDGFICRELSENDGSVLTLVALSAGNAEISVVASDGSARVTATFQVAVTAECPAWICRSWTRSWHLAIDELGTRPPGP